MASGSGFGENKAKICCDLPHDFPTKPHQSWGWKTIPVPQELPYFGSLLSVVGTSRAPPHLLRWRVEAPALTKDASHEPVVMTWPSDEKDSYLQFNMQRSPILLPCGKCPWKERWFRKTTFAGFFVKANAILFRCSKVGRPVFIYHANDRTMYGSAQSLIGSYFFYLAGLVLFILPKWVQQHRAPFLWMK